MAKKIKFKPEITRVKLNPEQAVLVCSCYSAGRVATDVEVGSTLCISNQRSYEADSCVQAIKASRS